MGKVMRHTLGASLNIRHNLSSSKGPKPLQLKLLTTYIPKTSAFTLAFSTSQRLRTTRRRSGLICLARSSRTGLDMSHILFMVEILLLTFLKGRGLLSDSDAVQPLIGKKS